MHLGEKLKQFRKARNFDQPAMAAFLGIGYRTYQAIEATGEVKKTTDVDKIKAKTGFTQKIADTSENAIDYQAKYYAMLEDDKAFFKELLASSLMSIAANQIDLHAHLKAILEREAEKVAGGNLKKKQVEMLRLSKLVAAHKENLAGTGIGAALSSVDRA